jgi:hypothetical protein
MSEAKAKISVDRQKLLMILAQVELALQEIRQFKREIQAKRD